MTAKDGKLTAAQQRARAWLPENGSWRYGPGKLTAALWSLSCAWPECVEREWGLYGNRKLGRPYNNEGYRWRFTPKGVEVHKIIRDAI